MIHTSSPRVVLTHALRTPIGRYLGAFADLSAADLGASVVQDLVGRAGVDPAAVGKVYFGNGRQAGGGPNLARQVAVRGGLGEACPATTINKACGSGLESIGLGADWIRLGRARAVVAGGAESMSGLPFFLPKFRRGYRMGHAPVVDSMYKDGFVCPLADMVMGRPPRPSPRSWGSAATSRTPSPWRASARRGRPSPPAASPTSSPR